MQYTNLPLDIPALIAMLKNRGLGFSDEAKATDFLENVSYFRFDAYLHPMELPNMPSRYKNGATFENAVALYEFDLRLREIIFSAIQRIEVSLRAKVINKFSLTHGTFWFIDSGLAIDQHKYSENLSTLERELQRSKDDFIKEHYKKYEKEGYPPSWKLLELSSFGCLTKLYFNFSDISAKKSIARSYQVPQHEILESWMKSINAVRNTCAHHGRLWNRVMPVMPQLPARLQRDWIAIRPTVANRLYSVFCCIVYWLNAIEPNNSLVSDFKKLLQAYPNVDTSAMGFPAGWKNEPLWS